MMTTLDSVHVEEFDETSEQPIRRLPLLMPSRFSPRTRWIVSIAGLLMLVVAALLMRQYTANPREFPVNQVEVDGTLDYTDRDELREKVVSHTLQGFYALDLDEIRRDVVKMPWVSESHLRRISPDRVSIEVFEHEPAARWNDDGLISKRFELFHPPQLDKNGVQRAEWLVYFSQLPQLRGAPGRHESVLHAFRTYQNFIDEFGVAIDALIEDDRFSQTVVLANNVSVRLGTTKQEERMLRFVDVYSRLVPELSGLPVKFDMRYSNGFAMTKPGSPRATNLANTRAIMPSSMRDGSATTENDSEDAVNADPAQSVDQTTGNN